MTGKAKILGIIGYECQVKTLLTLHVSRVHDIIFIEGDGTVSNRTDKFLTQQVDTVVIDIHVGKYVLQHFIDDIAQVKQIVNTRRTDAFYQGLLTTRVFAIEHL